jgi:hypothetical protein
VAELDALSTVLAFAGATLLMVLAGLTKNHLVWQRRPRRFGRRRR